MLRQGDRATTREVWDQEQRILAFARSGKGVFRPLAAGKAEGLDGLSGEQKAAVRHVWDSTDQLMLIRGGAGTGKTTMMTPALAKLGAPVVLLAPSADASRGQLRKEGFSEANTVAAFLGSNAMQGKAKNGIIWVDEAGLLPVGDLDRLCGVAKGLDARIVLQGDPRQHKAVQRHGNMLRVLEEYAGLPVAELKQIKRAERQVCRGGRGDPRPARWRKATPSSETWAGSSRARAMTGWSRNTPAPSRRRNPTAQRRPSWSSTRRTRTATG